MAKTLRTILHVIKRLRDDEDGVPSPRMASRSAVSDDSGLTPPKVAGLSPDSSVSDKPIKVTLLTEGPELPGPLRATATPKAEGGDVSGDDVEVEPRSIYPGDPPKPILGKDEDFSIFQESHAEEAFQLTAYFMSVPKENFETMMETMEEKFMAYNKELLLYVIRAALLHRPETFTVPFPPIWELTLRKFFKLETLNKVASAVHKNLKKAKKEKEEEVEIIDIPHGFSGN